MNELIRQTAAAGIYLATGYQVHIVEYVDSEGRPRQQRLDRSTNSQAHNYASFLRKSGVRGMILIRSQL